MQLSSPVQTLAGIGPQKSQELAEMEIHTVGDLIEHFPLRYLDASQTSQVSDLQDGELTTVHVELTSVENIRRRGGRPFVKVGATDGSDAVQLMFFHQPYRAKSLHVGERWAVTGKVKRQGRTAVFMNPTTERLGATYAAVTTGRVLPIYPQHGSINTRWLQKVFSPLQPYIAEWFPEYLSQDILEAEKLISRPEAWKKIHFPQSGLEAEAARRRLAFDELWEIFQTMQDENVTRQKHSSPLQFSESETEAFWQDFLQLSPFPPTPTQEKAMWSILHGLTKPWPLRQVVFGEVGSGKTLVAALSLLAVAKQGGEALYLAPTTVLAQQHFTTIQPLAEKAGVKVELILGAQKGSSEADSPVEPSGGRILIGTHALLHRSQTLKPQLVIIDEEHRFGVKQREKEWSTVALPHHITMTATPIPRTLAHVLYGNESYSSLEPIPGQVRDVTTRVVPATKLSSHWQWLSEQVQLGKQAFVIAPLIEQSETPGMENIAAATDTFEKAQSEAPGIRWGLLTGKTALKEKNRLLTALREHELDALVATPVIEVGVDIPDAAIITILSAERFGYAQLHQLRGRVGRRGQESWCFLMPTSPGSAERLRVMETITNGAELAEIDLQRRGAGEFFGTRQHGWDGLQIATWFDVTLLEQVQRVRRALGEKLKN